MPPRLNQTEVLSRNTSVSILGGIQLSGFFKSSPGVIRPRTLDRFVLIFVTRGSGFYKKSGSAKQLVQAGDVFIIPPNTEHTFGPTNGRTWDEIYIVFEGSIFDAWLSCGGLKWPSNVLSLDPLDYWINRFVKAAGQNNHGNTNAMMNEVMRLQQLLTDLFLTSKVEIEENLVWLENAKTALKSTKSPQFAAKASGLSYDSFRKRFKNLAGMPPGRFLTGVKMEEACELLSDNTLTIRSVAEQLEYCDEYHFSKQFKIIFGWTPSDYRTHFLPNKK